MDKDREAPKEAEEEAELKEKTTEAADAVPADETLSDEDLEKASGGVYPGTKSSSHIVYV